MVVDSNLSPTKSSWLKCEEKSLKGEGMRWSLDRWLRENFLSKNKNEGENQKKCVTYLLMLILRLKNCHSFDMVHSWMNIIPSLFLSMCLNSWFRFLTVREVVEGETKKIRNGMGKMSDDKKGGLFVGHNNWRISFLSNVIPHTVIISLSLILLPLPFLMMNWND